MLRKDFDFLQRAERTLENYNRRIDALAERIEADEHSILQGLWFGTFRDLDESTARLERYHALIAERDAHQARVESLREQQQRERDIKFLCAEANKLSGTDGANFFTKAGKIFKEATPDE